VTSKKFDSNSRVTKSYNSYEGGISKTKRILKVLRESEHPLKPKEIAFFTKINRSTCRVYLRRLLEKQEVSQPYPQVYVTKPIHGMGEPSLVLVHNLVLSVRVAGFEPARLFEEWFGAIKVRVVFGCKRRQVTCFVSCDAGMDLDKVCFVLDKFKSVVFGRIGVRLRDDMVRVVSCELNEDRRSIRLDGVKCVTVKDFVGNLERIYNKGDGLRSEVKVQPLSVDHMLALMKGGMTSFHILQSVALLGEKMDQLTEVMKQNNRFTLQVLDALKELKV
jgi:hypothetical protein